MANEKKQVFYIDDEPEMIELVRLILGRKGYQVSGASSGREGLTALCQCQDPPDLVLLDLMMPDMDGWEVYQQMKANEGTRDIPVIVITAKAQSIDKVLGLHIAKVEGYISKPFGSQDLVENVDRVLAEQEKIGPKPN